jgi:predicted amidohydrolase
MARLIRVALCQATSAIGAKGVDPRPENVERAASLMRRATAEGAQLLLFGEIYLNGYRSDETLREFSTTLTPPDEYMCELLQVARELDIIVAMGVCRRAQSLQGGLFNSAVVFSQAGIIGWYDKVHLGTFPLFDGRVALEGAIWRPGREYKVLDTPAGRIGLQICRDIRFPEASRVLALKGAELIVNLSAAAQVRVDSWDYFTRARAAENLVWLAMTSVVGGQRDSRLFGGSRIVDPYGRIVARSRDDEEDLVVQEIDLDEIGKARSMSHVFDTRVPAAYAAITEQIPSE